MIFILVFIALAVTLIAVEVVGDSRRHSQLSAPVVLVNAEEVSSHPGLVVDPDDGGVHETRIVVASAAPLTFLDARYTVQFAEDPQPIVVGGSFGKAKAALLAKGLRPSAFAITQFSPTATLVPGRELVAFALAKPTAPRFARLEAEMTFADPVGRRVTELVSALPDGGQALDPPVAAREREPAG